MDDTLGRSIGAEFLATVLVVLAGPGLMMFGADDVGTVEIALSVGAATAIAIGVLGAVANPMFSLALWLSRSITKRELITDWIGQVLGGVFGALVLWGLNDATRLTRGLNRFQPDGARVNMGGAADLGVVIGGELLFATLIVVVLLSAIGQTKSDLALGGIVGAMVAIATAVMLPSSGAGFNPARSIGMAIFGDADPHPLSQVWVFILVPLVAAVAGLFIWLAVDDSTVDDTVFDDTIIEDAVDSVTADD